MIVKKLQLINFRNYEKEEISFDPGINVITGDNAQGKTNLLESLIYLSLTRSYRIHEDKELIMHGKEYARISCIYEDDREKRIEAIISSNGKNLLVNKVPMKKSSEFIGLLNTVLFSPDDLSIFKDSPRTRRRLVDQEITKVSSQYLGALTRYQNLLKNRNSILKEFHPDENYLNIIDNQIIQEELFIIKERNDFINHINRNMVQIYQTLSNDDNVVQISYLSCADVNDLENNLKAMYEISRKKDLESHVTTTGIHREDILFCMNDKNLIYTASQGQKRMTMLAFKISLLSYIEEKIHKKPILLLDDVLSELDQIRQQKLIEMVQGPYQCLITSTDIPVALRNIVRNEYIVKQGKILKKGRTCNE